ncbi:MAG: Fic family protein [Candidatus Thermoplasmatota archaeon]|nr:Fic family protein [Candidatus Thermoplasmatota archaeon]
MNKNILNSLRGVLLERMDLSAIPDEIWKRSSALNTWGTNALEGSTIKWMDAQRLLLEEKTAGNRPIRDVLETMQHDEVFRGLLMRMERPIDLVTVLELHEEVFRGVLPDAGHWRRMNVRIQGAGHTPPRMEKIVHLMEDLLDDYRNRDTRGDDIFELGSWFHFHFESIHPFLDGNGRVGRLLLNIHFLKHNWPPIHILPSNRDDYLLSLENAGQGDFIPLTSLFERLMGSSLLDLLDKVGTADDELLDLKTITKSSPYDAKYLALRCGQGELPGVLTGHRWRTSRRALKLYIGYLGRKGS